MDNPANPHRLPMEYWVYIPEMMMDMVISAALSTQVIRSNAGQGLLTYAAKTSGSENLKRHNLGAVNHPSRLVSTSTSGTHSSRSMQS